MCPSSTVWKLIWSTRKWSTRKLSTRKWVSWFYPLEMFYFFQLKFPSSQHFGPNKLLPTFSSKQRDAPSDSEMIRQSWNLPGKKWKNLTSKMMYIMYVKWYMQWKYHIYILIDSLVYYIIRYRMFVCRILFVYACIYVCIHRILCRHMSYCIYEYVYIYTIIVQMYKMYIY